MYYTLRLNNINVFQCYIYTTLSYPIFNIASLGCLNERGYKSSAKYINNIYLIELSQRIRNAWNNYYYEDSDSNSKYLNKEVLELYNIVSKLVFPDLDSAINFTNNNIRIEDAILHYSCPE